MWTKNKLDTVAGELQTRLLCPYERPQTGLETRPNAKKEQNTPELSYIVDYWIEKKRKGNI